MCSSCYLSWWSSCWTNLREEVEKAAGDVIAASPLGRGGTPAFFALPSQLSTGHVTLRRAKQLATPSSAELTGHDLLWCAIPLLPKQPFSMSTNGVFVVLHEKQRGGEFGVGCVRARPGECWWAARLFGPVRRPCLVKRCQSEWRGGADARPAGAVMQEGSHVESGLANGKWVTPSWAESAAWPRHYYLPSPRLCAHSEPH